MVAPEGALRKPRLSDGRTGSSGADSLATHRPALPEDAHVLGPAAGNGTPHEFNAIFFDPARLEVLDSGGFWLSETPERYSSAWRTRVVRSANWTKFRTSDAAVSVLHVNTHLDHVSSLARAQGSGLILRTVGELCQDGLPVVVTGDFNCPPGSVPYRTFTAAGFEDTFLAAGHEDAEGVSTFHAFGGVRHALLCGVDVLRRGRRHVASTGSFSKAGASASGARPRRGAGPRRVVGGLPR